MAEVVLFHHAQGLTPGVVAFADELRRAGHTVHTPEGVPAQVHGMDADPIFVGEGDVDAARELVEQASDAELFLYPGDQHYFADSSLPSDDPEATALLVRRVLDFLRTR
jgi:dienelactone hydrolase